MSSGEVTPPELEEELQRLEELRQDANKLVSDINEFTSRIFRLYMQSLRSISRTDIAKIRQVIEELTIITSDITVKLDQFKMKLVELTCKASDEVHTIFKHYLYEYLPAKYHSLIMQREIVEDLLREEQVIAALTLFVDYVADILELAAQLFAIARGLAEYIGMYYNEFKQYYEQVKEQYEKISKELQQEGLPMII